MEDYPDFIYSCGYGKIQGIVGINCRHQFMPFYPGISTNPYSPEELEKLNESTVTYTATDGTERRVSVYEATQRQREIERKITQWKRRLAVEKAIDDSARPEKITQANRKIKEWQKAMRDFIEETGLRRQYPRERIAKNPNRS